MKHLLIFAAVLWSLNAFAQTESVFDNDPMQHLPIGMEVSDYLLRTPTGNFQGGPR